MKAIIFLITLLALATAWNQGRPVPQAPPVFPGQPYSGQPGFPGPAQPGFPQAPQPMRGWRNDAEIPTGPKRTVGEEYIPNTLNTQRRFNAMIAFEAFAAELGLTQEHKTAFQACAMELRSHVLPLVAGGKAAAQAKILSFIFASDAEHREFINTVISKVQTELPQCRDFVMSLGSVFGKATVSEHEQYIVAAHQNLLKYRVQIYSSEIVSTLFNLVGDKMSGKSKEFGQKIATIVKMITGLSHPETVVDYVMNYEKNHKDVIELSVLETDRFIHQALNVAAKELGSTEQISEQRIKELRQAVEGFVHVYINAIYKVRSASSIVEREVELLGAIRDLIKAGGVVAENVKLIAPAFAPALHQLSNLSPRSQAMVIIHNYFARLPTVQRRVIDISLENHHHHPTATGKAIAGLIKTLTN